ncbi:hypothetical protein BDZ91DRAFT_739700, partial [Kalaharituber pfeilii]
NDWKQVEASRISGNKLGDTCFQQIPRLSGRFYGFPAGSAAFRRVLGIRVLLAGSGAGLYIGVLEGVRRIARVSGSAARVRVLASSMLVASIGPELEGLGRGVRVGLLHIGRYEDEYVEL